MSFQVEPEPATRVLPNVTMTEELAKAIHDATTPDALKNLIIAAADQQEAAAAQSAAAVLAAQEAADKVLADKAVADAAAAQAAAANQTFTRHVVIGDQSFDFVAQTEAEIDQLELNAFKVAYAVRPTASAPVAAATSPDPALAVAAEEARAAAVAELDKQFRLGEVTAKDYIEQSGAIKGYLESQGVSLEALQEVVTANRGAKFSQSWAEAGVAFQKTPAGLDWPGGDKNHGLMALQIAAMGLEEAPDKVAALTQAYAELKRTGLYFPNGDSDVVPAAVVPAAVVPAAVAAPVVNAEVAAAKVALDAALARAAAKTKSTSSTVFGAGTGPSSAPVLSPAVVAAKQVIPDNASPQEIMAAYKEGLIAAGKDPNEAYKEQIRAENAR